MGSRINDGVYLIEDDLIMLKGAKNEVFSGKIAHLIVPFDFLELAGEIKEFKSKQNPAGGNITSEKWLNYSYNKATNPDGVTASWREVFMSRLNKFRKMFEEKI
jgi:hypothetical protein